MDSIFHDMHDSDALLGGAVFTMLGAATFCALWWTERRARVSLQATNQEQTAASEGVKQHHNRRLSRLHDEITRLEDRNDDANRQVDALQRELDKARTALKERDATFLENESAFLQKNAFLLEQLKKEQERVLRGVQSNKQLRDDMEANRAALTHRINDLEKAHSTISREAHQITKERDHVQAALAKTKQKSRELREGLDDKIKQLAQAHERIASLTTQVSSLESQVTNRGHVDHMKSCTTQTLQNHEITSHAKELESYKAQVSAANLLNEQLRLAVDSGKEMLRESQTKLAETSEELRIATVKLEDTTSELRIATQQLETAAAQPARNGTPLETAKQQLEEQEKQLEEANAQHAQVRNQLEKANVQLEDARNQLEEAQQRLAENEFKLAESQSRLQGANNTCASLHTTVDKLQEAAHTQAQQLATAAKAQRSQADQILRLSAHMERVESENGRLAKENNHFKDQTAQLLEKEKTLVARSRDLQSKLFSIQQAIKNKTSKRFSKQATQQRVNDENRQSQRFANGAQQPNVPDSPVSRASVRSEWSSYSTMTAANTKNRHMGSFSKLDATSVAIWDDVVVPSASRDGDAKPLRSRTRALNGGASVSSRSIASQSNDSSIW